MRQEAKAAIFFGSLVLCSILKLCSADQSEVDDESSYLYKEKDGRGPKEWGKLKPEWRVCGTGKLQSPIDLLNERVNVIRNPGRWRKDYRAASAVLVNRGHDIMVNWTGYAGKQDINGTDYKLVQCHWHTPSEHTINGTRYKMELHMVHKSVNGKIAVTAVLYKLGKPDPFLAKIFSHIKSVKNEEKINLGIVDPRDIKFGTRKFYRYIGSLTSPPCTEGVVWTVVNRVRRVSEEQVKALREAVHDGFEENARPRQRLEGRPVWYYLPNKN